MKKTFYLCGIGHLPMIEDPAATAEQFLLFNNARH